MDNLRIDRIGHTLVDQVEEKLIEYFKEQGLRPGDSIPNETELAASLGIGRTVLREALSRFKMTGMIESRTKRGMILAEPSILSSLRRSVNPLLMTEKTLLELLEFRIALEIGCSNALFNTITPENIRELEIIVDREEAGETQRYHLDQCEFHVKLYDIIDNNMITEFQEAILPALDYVLQENKEEFDRLAAIEEAKDGFVSHKQLLEHIKAGDQEAYVRDIEKHFSIYINFFVDRKQKLAESKKAGF